MIEKLKEIISKYNIIESKMSDPSLVNNLDEFKKVTKEHNRLKPIVEKSIIFINSKNQLSDNLELIENEKDTDLIMLAKEENDFLSSQISPNRIPV